MQSQAQRKAALEALLETFKTPGWEEFKSDIEALKGFGDSNAVEACHTNEEWQEWRGRSRAYGFVLGYEKMIELTLQGMNEPNEPEDPTNTLED